MEVQKIESGIISEAESKANKIKKDAYEEREIILDKARIKIEEEKKRIKKSFESRMFQTESKEIAFTRMSTKKEILLQKKNSIDEIYESLFSLVNSELDKKEFLETLYEIGKKNLDAVEKIYVNERDLEIAKNIHSEAGVNNIKGGMILENNYESIDLSIETIISMVKSKTLKSTSEIIFSD